MFNPDALDPAVFDVQVTLGDDWRGQFDLQFVISPETAEVIGAMLGEIELTAEQANQLLKALN